MEAMQTTTFGDYLKQKRLQRRLTQADVLRELAQRGAKHYTDTVVTHWEKNRAMPPLQDPKFVRMLADILGVSNNEILEAAGFALDSEEPADALRKRLNELIDQANSDELDRIIAIASVLIERQKQQTSD